MAEKGPKTVMDLPRNQPFEYTRQPIDDILDAANQDLMTRGTCAPGSKGLLE